MKSNAPPVLRQKQCSSIVEEASLEVKNNYNTFFRVCIFFNRKTVS